LDNGSRATIEDARVQHVGVGCSSRCYKSGITIDDPELKDLHVSIDASDWVKQIVDKFQANIFDSDIWIT